MLSDRVWPEWNSGYLKIIGLNIQKQLIWDLSECALHVPPEGTLHGAVRSTHAPLPTALSLLQNLPRVRQENEDGSLSCLISVQPQQFCSWISHQNCNHRECQVWLMWWTHPGCMLREYQGFITTTHDVSLDYLRIEEYLPAHLFLLLAAWTVGPKRKLQLSSTNAKSQINYQEKNPKQKSKPKPENINYSGIQLNLIYTGLGVAAS